MLSVNLYKSSFPNQLLPSTTDDDSLHSFSKIKYVLSSTGVQLLHDALHDIINEVFQTLDQSYSSLFELELSTIMDQKVQSGLCMSTRSLLTNNTFVIVIH